MKRTFIPGTSLQVSRFSCGTANLHHLPGSQKRLHFLLAAADAGFSHFDTSPLYGFGLAEAELGRLLRHRKGLTIATKIGLYPPEGATGSTISIWFRKAAGKLVPELSRAVVNWSLDVARASLETSLRRLGRQHVEVLFLHEPIPGLVNADEWLRWLENQRSEGRIEMWGLAGNPEPMVPWVSAEHAVCNILQIKDSLSGREADCILAAGRKLQFTYGYLSAQPDAAKERPIAGLLGDIFARNSTGSVIVSTRRVDRLIWFAEAAA